MNQAHIYFLRIFKSEISININYVETIKEELKRVHDRSSFYITVDYGSYVLVIFTFVFISH